MSGPPTKVAIVDDEASVRTALARLLGTASFEVKTYGTAREFIDSIRIEIPECLVVDVHMPKFTGLDLLRYLNRNKEKIPTVVITAFDDENIRQRCQEFFASAYLTKPLHGPALIQCIRSAVSGKISATNQQPSG